MNNPGSASVPSADLERAQMLSAMFAHLVMQHTNMSLIFLGHTPNPQTGQTGQDLEHARYFIDQLEMLEAKTKGNLTKQEEGLLAQSLTSLRLAYVDAINNPKPSPSSPPAPAPESAPAPDSPPAPATDEQETPVTEPALPGEKTSPATEAESRKMFSKKYS